jgi:isoquinoline 1-oxidoreductase beta subunit
MKKHRKWTRRAFIGAGTIVGGGFVLGVGELAFAPSRHSVRPGNDPGQLNTWITVAPDNRITVLVPHCEMGQGIQTALAMMAAEEMDADWSLIHVKEAPALDEYANGYIARAFAGDSIPGPMERGFDYGMYRLMRIAGLQMTGGSTSIRSTGQYGMTLAGAAARQMLIAAGAAKFGVKPADCIAQKSRVIHSASNRSATFGELAADAAKLSIPTKPALKDPNKYTIRHTALPRIDIPSKVNGSAKYGIDVVIPGMLQAAIDLAPVYGGKLASVDTTPAESMPGVKKVITLDDGVAVVADSYWRARKALAALKPQYTDAGNGGVSTATIFAAFDKSLGEAPKMPDGAAKTITADYKVPFLGHATMEPMVCTAKVEGDRAEIWAGSQDPLNARGTAAKALGVSAENITYNNFALGGGFGRRLPYYLDYIDIGARIAKAMSPTPIKTIWSRENDIQRDYYRPAGMARFAGALDANGAPLAVKSFYAGGGDGESVFMPYAIKSKDADARDAKHPIRTGPWRSVLNSQHGFFKESFIDEMAYAAGKDPYRFRLDLLNDQPLFRGALEKAATMSGWGTPLPAGEGRGIAITQCFGSIVAEVAHVAVSPDGQLQVKHIYAAVDCGPVVNTDTAAAQAEGGIIFGLSAALLGEITIAEGKAVQRNFRDYRMIKIKDAPDVSVEFMQSGAPIGGLGEPCVPPVGPAVANAIFAACGIRVRELPIKNTKLAKTD